MSSDWETRKAAVKRTRDSALLFEIAQHDPDSRVAAAATQRIRRPDLLRTLLASDSTHLMVRLAAMSNISDQSTLIEVFLREAARTATRNNGATRVDAPPGNAARDVIDPSSSDEACQKTDTLVAAAALRRITDQAFLGDLAMRRDVAYPYRAIAISRLVDQQVLFDFIRHMSGNWDSQVAEPGEDEEAMLFAALGALTDQYRLFAVAKEADAWMFWSLRAAGIREGVMTAIMEGLDDQELLRRAFKELTHLGYWSRLTVVRKLTDTGALVEIARVNHDADIRWAAVQTIVAIQEKKDWDVLPPVEGRIMEMLLEDAVYERYGLLHLRVEVVDREQGYYSIMGTPWGQRTLAYAEGYVITVKALNGAVLFKKRYAAPELPKEVRVPWRDEGRTLQYAPPVNISEIRSVLLGQSP